MDFGLNTGVSTYIGEIGNAGSKGFKPFILYTQPDATSGTMGGFFRYNFKRRIAARLDVNWVRIAGADSLSDEPSRVGRNLSFRTDLVEFSMRGEYSFINTSFGNPRTKKDFAANVYLGIGYMLFYPTATYNNVRYNLRPLATEGEENAYGLGSMIFPMGMNFNFTFSEQWRLGIDFCYRFTLTDYLDDVSTDYAEAEELPYNESIYFANRSEEAYLKGREDLPQPEAYIPGKARGNPETNDGYFTVSLQVSYVIQLEKGRNRLRKNKSHKPRKNRGVYFK